MTQHKPDDDPRDAHLLAALRHAPDRDVAPPAQLTAAILDKAQQAVAASSPARGRTWRDGLAAALERLFTRLWQPAPMAAFGTLALATLIGVMWGGQERPDATPSQRPAPVAAPPDEAAAAAGGVLASSPQVLEEARDAAKPEAPMPARAKAAKPAAPAATPRPATAVTRQDAARERETAGNGALPAAPPAESSTAAAESARMATAPMSAHRDAPAKSMADAAPAAARSRGEAAPALGAAAQTVASPLAGARADIDAAVGVDASQVRWQVAAQRLVAHGAAQREWWSALARATEGHWVVVDPPALAATPWLVLVIDGQTRAVLGLQGDAVLWTEPSGRTWRAPITPTQGREWQAAVARW